MGICLSNQSRSDQGDSSVPPIRLVPLVTPTLKCFKLTDLRKATQNFKTDSQLGETVYKGWIDNRSFKPSRPRAGVAVCVKRQCRGFHDEAEWIDELHFFGNYHHPNILHLIGYCSEGDERLFVSEYMVRGNLENYLYGVSKCSLSWNLRFKIVLGVAKGLAFLHSAVVEGGYEADFNPSKVLLDFDHNPKLYGFRRHPNDDNIEKHSRVLGSYTYYDPEYQYTGVGTSPQCDVYSYGLVLLEVVLGRRVELREKAEWRKCNCIQLDQLLETGLEGKYPLDEAHALAKLAVRCIMKNPRTRPSMEEVVVELESLQKSA